MDFDDYETLPSSSTGTHMIAGAFAGIMEHCLMYPLDSVKTRMQSLQPALVTGHRSVTETLCKMVHEEGLFRPMRGMPAVVFGAGPAHALYFACYEKMKRLISGTENGAGHPMAQCAAGALSTLLHDAIMNPADVVKQRMQMCNSPYRKCIDCLHKVWKAEGAKAFYRSYTTQLTMNVPFQCIHFMAYEFCQDLTNHDRTYNPKAHMVSGAFSGALAAALTTPLDVCKTLLNTQEKQALHVTKQTHITGLMNAAATVYRLRGPTGFLRGLNARVMYQVPSAAIAWSTYEFFKFTILSNYQNQHKHTQDHNPLVASTTAVEHQHSSNQAIGQLSLAVGNN